MRLPKPSSASLPTIACNGTPACRVRVPISPTSLPCSVRSVELALAGDDGARGAHALVEVERVQDERGARFERGAVLGPQAAGADVAQHDDLRPADPAGVLDRLQGACAAVGGGRAADRDQDHGGARVRGGGDQLAGAVGARVPSVSFGFRHEPETARHRQLDDRRAAVLDQAEARTHRVPQRAFDLVCDQLAAELREQRVERALAAVGDRAQIGRHQAGALEAAADRAGDPGGVERALEGVGGDEDGALRYDHFGILSGLAVWGRRSTRCSSSTAWRSSCRVPTRSISPTAG